jgi:hypothetical protein
MRQRHQCLVNLNLTYQQLFADFRLPSGRELFNLSRIELRCNVSPGITIAVEPIQVSALDWSAGEDSPTSSPAAMELDSKPSPAQHPGPQSAHRDQHHELHHRHHYPHQQPFHPSDTNRQSLPSISAMRSPPNLAPLHTAPPKAYANMLPSISPALKSAHETSQDAQSYSSEATVDMAKDQVPRLRPVEEPSYSNGYHHPRLQEAHPDAGERMQTQPAQTLNALAPQGHHVEDFEERIRQVEANLRREFQAHLHRQDSDIHVLGEAVAGLHQDTHSLRQSIDSFARDLHKTRSEIRARGFNGAPGPAPIGPSQTAPVQTVPAGAQDAALELMAQQVAMITHKAGEIDVLKVTIEIMKGKIHRLENESSQPAATSYQPGLQATQAVVSQTHSHGQPPHSQGHHSHEGSIAANVQDLAQRPAPEQNQVGWASVNAGVKRHHQDGTESPLVAATPTFGSPKRQKLADVETRSVYDASQTPSRIHTPTQTLPSQPHPASESGPGPQSQHPTYIPYGTQEGPSGDGWRPESQRMIQQRPLRGRGSRGGRGPGSRGGRVRKSLPAQSRPPGTPDWDRESWQSMQDGQTPPSGYYNQTPNPARTISRRGGGSMRGGYSPNDRAASLGLHNANVGMSIESPPLDQYGQPKKSRSKPIRNADGVLIRKDGRPDMRSQSSAANLRKVHARKDEQRDDESGFTPTNRQYTASAATNTPSPSRQFGASSDPNVSSSVQKKHNDILDRMFPNGLDASLRDNDYAHQVFNEDQDHTAHTRRRSHHTSSQTTAKRSLPIKKEQYDETHDAASQRSNSDVDMDRTEGPTDDEGRTPPESQSDASERDYTQKIDTPARPEQQRSEVRISEMQDVEGANTVAIEPTLGS